MPLATLLSLALFSGAATPPPPAPDPTVLVVNEILASNDTTVADEAGEFDDWVEVYNGSSEAVSLAGVFFTDDLTEPDKFALPDTTIAAGGYLLIWADDDEDQGPLHASFKLSADGEDAALYVADGAGGFTLIDGVTFGAQETDVSYGRAMDGADEFVFFQTPTPSAENRMGTDAEAGPGYGLAITAAFPNPLRDRLTVSVRTAAAAVVSMDLVDALGRRVASLAPRAVGAGAHRLEWTGALAAGTYLAVVRSESASGVAVRSQRVTIAR
ncbi:lamin tail domain-containing protein [Rubrivirga sp.]|uniref:lamin tail domain-containing protein n=1 Tax=Rubrivirga sp. TaxID=1885344 RepID=UPI003B51C382